MRYRLLLSLLLAISIPLPTFAQSTSSQSELPESRVAVFRDLETRLATALHNHDEATLESLLRPDYTLTVAIAGGLVEVDRATWLKNAVTTRTVHDFEIKDLVVREYGNIAVVSSRYEADATVDGIRRTTDYFLTDVWEQSEATWKLSARYSSRPE